MIHRIEKVVVVDASFERCRRRPSEDLPGGRCAHGVSLPAAVALVLVLAVLVRVLVLAAVTVALALVLVAAVLVLVLVLLAVVLVLVLLFSIFLFCRNSAHTVPTTLHTRSRLVSAAPPPPTFPSAVP